MSNPPASTKKQLQELQAKLKVLQEELAIASKQAGVDAYIDVRLSKNKAMAERIKVVEGPDKAYGQFNLLVDITAKQDVVYIPCSVATGVKQAGFMYQIEGTSPGSIKTATVSCQGEGVTQVTLGTLLYSKIPAGKTATFALTIVVRGRVGQTYQVALTRINYKRVLTEARYQQYLKEIKSTSVKFL